MIILYLLSKLYTFVSNFKCYDCIFPQSNGAAALGNYSGCGAGAAGGESLFVANHAYWAYWIFKTKKTHGTQIRHFNIKLENQIVP